MCANDLRHLSYAALDAIVADPTTHRRIRPYARALMVEMHHRAMGRPKRAASAANRAAKIYLALPESLR